MCLSLGYPDEEAEYELLHEQTKPQAAEAVVPVVSMQDIAASREEQRLVFVHPALERVIAGIGKLTRTHPAFKLGSSPRAGIHLLQLARTFALICGRNWVEDDDIRVLAPLVLAHRCVIKTGMASGTASGTVPGSIGTAAGLISEITETVIRTVDKSTDWTQAD